MKDNSIDEDDDDSEDNNKGLLIPIENKQGVSKRNRRHEP